MGIKGKNWRNRNKIFSNDLKFLENLSKEIAKDSKTWPVFIDPCWARTNKEYRYVLSWED